MKSICMGLLGALIALSLSCGVFSACGTSVRADGGSGSEADAQPSNVITALLEKSEALVGETIAVRYFSSDGSAVSAEYSKDGGAGVAFSGGSFTAQERGLYVFTFTAPNAEAVRRTLLVRTETDALFAGGSGTEGDPYQIQTAEQFLGILSLQGAILETGASYSFALTADIDLTAAPAQGGAEGDRYLIEVFAGTLDGQGHTIFCGDGADWLFRCFYNSAAFCDLNIAWSGTAITRLVGCGAYAASAEEGGVSACAAETLELTFENVDYRGKDGAVYAMGDDRAALYRHGAGDAVYAYADGVFVPARLSEAGVGGEAGLSLRLLLSGCDVTADFTGGYGDAGAAVFLGSLGGGVTAAVIDCSYTGTFTGKNVGVLIADAAYGDGDLSNVTVRGLTVCGSVCALGGNAGITFGNSTAEAEGVTEANLACVEHPAQDETLALGVSLFGEYVITAATSSEVAYYVIRIRTATVLRYEDETYAQACATSAGETLTFRIETSRIGATGVCRAYAVSLREALDSRMVTSLFACTLQSQEGLYCGNAEINGTHYLIIDYERSGRYCKFASLQTVTASVYAMTADGVPVAYAEE